MAGDVRGLLKENIYQSRLRRQYIRCSNEWVVGELSRGNKKLWLLHYLIIIAYLMKSVLYELTFGFGSGATTEKMTASTNRGENKVAYKSARDLYAGPILGSPICKSIKTYNNLHKAVRYISLTDFCWISSRTIAKDKGSFIIQSILQDDSAPLSFVSPFIKLLIFRPYRRNPSKKLLHRLLTIFPSP